MFVLIVDDNRINRLVLSKMVERIGARVECACNGQEALDAIARMRPDIVLMDLSMPIMDGFTATRQIRETLDHEQLPVHAVSAHSGDLYLERCRADGFNSFIPKPVARERIAEVIAAVA